MSWSGLELRGKVHAGAFALSPATGTACVAYVLELYWQDGGRSQCTFRDAVSVGFEIVLSDGRLAEIPPGDIQLAGRVPQTMDVDNPALEAYLQAKVLGQQHRENEPENEPERQRSWGGDSAMLRYNVIREAVVIPGDTVVLAGPFEPVVIPMAPAPIYREPAPSVLVPVGVAKLGVTQS